jgi:menaquinol-cytochrome c reductase iron-sulfur subunit
MSAPVTPESEKTLMNRRGFLTSVTLALGGVVGLVLGGSGAAYLLSPAWRKKQEEWIEVARLRDLPAGNPVKVDYVKRKADGWMVVEGRSSVWLMNEGKSVIAFDPKCTHLGCPYRWEESQQQFLCPCHTAVFSKMGEVVSGPPPKALNRFPVKVEGGVVFILPEVAGHA